MDPILLDTYQLLNNLFDEDEIAVLKEIEDEITSNPVHYVIDKLWGLDRNIGGIGAYSMPANPVRNPLPRGIGRTIYRPLQYARANIEINNINDHSRYAIQNVGLHLEGLVKYIVKKERMIGIMPSSKMTLGQAINKLHTKNHDERNLTNLKYILGIYNMSKHGVNNDENRQRTFTPMDAIIFYLSSRKIGNSLLTNYREDLYMEIENYIDRLDIN